MIRSVLMAYQESWRMLKEKRKAFIYLLLPIGLIKIMAPLIIPFMLRMIFDAMESGNGNQILISVAQSSIAFFILLFTVFLVNVYGDAWATRLSFYGIQKGYSSFFNLPVCQLIANYSKGEIYNRINAGCRASLQLWFKSIDLISNFTAVLGLLIMASLISPYILYIVLLLCITDFLVTLYLAKRNSLFTKNIQKQEDHRLEILHSVVYDSRFLKMNNAQSLICQLYSKAREKRFEEEYRQVRKNALFTSVMDILAASFHSLLGLILLFQNRDNEISLGGISSASAIFNNLRTKSGDLAKAASNLPNNVVPIQRMEELLSSADTSFEPKLTRVKNDNVIEIENISLQINNKTILDRINLKVRYGEKIAIIGFNGSGKSSLIKLLAGQYQYHAGEMKIFGKDATLFGISSDRDMWISYIPGESQLYTKESVLENIEMGALATNEDNIDIVLNNFSLGAASFKTTLTDKISGGEAQRVNICRAMIRPRPLTLADEPTALLDIELAEQVIDYLLCKNQTVIYITQNPAHALKADRIIYMENGSIVEELNPHSAKVSETFANWVGGYHFKRVGS